MAFIPIALQLLPLIPGLVDNALKIVDAVKSDPATPADVKESLEEVSRHLDDAVARVKAVRLPGDA